MCDVKQRLCQEMAGKSGAPLTSTVSGSLPIFYRTMLRLKAQSDSAPTPLQGFVDQAISIHLLTRFAQGKIFILQGLGVKI